MKTNTSKFALVTAVVAMALAATGLVITMQAGGHGMTSAALAAPGSSSGTAENGNAAPAPAREARQFADQLSRLFEYASDKVGPSVVPIYAEQTADVGGMDQMQQYFGDEFFHRFFNMPDGSEPDQGWHQKVKSVGSGVIVSEDGYILTNNHVVSNAEKLTVVLDDGKRLDAKIVGTDPQTDVAVIKVDARGLPAATLADNDDTHVGQWVIAVGNPFQLLHSVTAGIISAKGRSAVGLAPYEDFIQTDASINPGNSGGALADLDGNVIGINTAISSPSGASAGIGFAIPVGMAKKVMDALIAEGKVSRGYLALVPQDLDENLAKAMGTGTQGGALVGDVVDDGPAAKAGIQRGDIITQFNGRKVKDSTDLRRQVAETAPRSKVQVAVLRDGHHETVDVTLAERPADSDAQGRTSPPQKDDVEKGFGLGLRELTPDVAHQLGYETQKGALVASVAPGSPAEEAGLRRGDLIQEVDHHRVDDVAASVRELKKADKEDSVLLLVRRGQVTFFSALAAS